MGHTYQEKREILATAAQTKLALNKAFKALRKQGFIARQNFSCCNGCAGNEIANEVEAKIDAGKLREGFKGSVFYTRQQRMITESKRTTIIQKVYLSFGPLDTSKHGEKGVSTKEAGDLVAEALKDAGVTFEWDGSPDQCILVDPCPGKWLEHSPHSLRVWGLR